MPRLRLTGTPAVTADDGSAWPLERKDAALLAILALDGPTPRDTLAALLWPEATREKARLSLRQRVFRLRRRAGHALVETGATLRLADGVALDGLPGADAPGLPPREELLGAHDHADLDALSDWVASQRERWRARRRAWLAAAAAREEAEGRFDRAVDLTRALLDDDPLLEDAQRRLMRLHYRRGDRTAALAVFDRFERQLAKALGASPDAETRALRATILSAGADAPPRRPAVPGSLVRPPRVIGRAAAEAALAAAGAGSHWALLVGEPGMGKSRLLADWARAQAGRVHVQARPGDDPLPLALMARLARAMVDAHGPEVLPADPVLRAGLAPLLPELGGDTTASHALTLRALEDLLRGGAHAGLAGIAVDDLHFADAASLDALGALIVGERVPGLGFALARRPAEGGPALDALEARLAESQRLHRVVLPGLDLPAVRDLVASLALPGVDARDCAEPLSRHTGGNPLFLLETLREVVAAGAWPGTPLPSPRPVGELIERRLAALSPAARSLVRAAALAGEAFSVALAEQVLGRPALELSDAWAELEAAQVLAGHAFAHDLVQDAARRLVPEAIARHTHEAIARFLATHGEEPATVAAHWAQAGRPAEAAAGWAAAADRAKAAALRREERALRQRAALAFDDAGDADAAFAQRVAGAEALAFVGSVEDAVAETRALVDASGTPAQRVRSVCTLAQLLGAQRRMDEMETLAREALSLAEGLGDDLHAVSAAVCLGQAWAAGGRPVDAMRLYDQAAGRASALPAAARMPLHSARAQALLYLDRRRDATAELDEAIRLAEAVGDAAEQAIYQLNLGVVLVELGRPGDARQSMAQARRLRLRTGSDETSVSAIAGDIGIGSACAALGRYDEAIEALERAHAATASPQLAVYAVRVDLALVRVWLALGQRARAGAALRPALHAGPDGVALAWLARRLLADAAPQRQRPPPPDEAAQVHIPNTRRQVLLERLRDLPADDAARQAGTLADELAQGESLALAQAARLVELESLMRAGSVEAAARRAGALVRDAATVVSGFLHRPRLFWTAARALQAAGEAEPAEAALGAAAAWIEGEALPHVPAAFRDSFLNRHPIHREVLAAARRRPAG